MNITFTFEDVSPDDAIRVEKLIDHKFYDYAYKGGKGAIRKQVRELAENVDKELNDISFSNDLMDVKRRRLYTLVWDTIDQLRKIGKGE